MLPSERTVHSRSGRSVCLHLWGGEMLGGVGAAVGGGGSSSKRRHSTQSLSLLYRPSKPDIDLIRDHTRRGSTCGTGTATGGPSAGLTESVTGSFLGLRRHSEVVSPSTSTTSPVGGGGRQVRLSIDSGRVVQEFHFVKRGFFKSADQIYNKVFGGAAASGGSGSSSSAGGGGGGSSTADAYAQHYGGSRSRSKSFNALGGGPLINATTSPGGVVADFSSLGQAIESHLRNQLRRATFSNINDGGVATAGSAAAAAASLQPTSQRPRSHSTCVVSFPTIIVTQEPQVGGSGGSSSSHHPQQPTQSLVRTEYKNKTQVILEESSSPCSSSNNNSSATSGGTSSSSSATLCGLVREILARTFSVGVGFIRGHPHHPPNNAAASASSNKRFFF